MTEEQYAELLKKAEFTAIFQAEVGRDLAEVREHLTLELNKQTKEIYKGYTEINNKIDSKIDRLNDRIDKMIHLSYGLIFTLVAGFIGTIVAILKG